MYSEEMYELGSRSSVIREIFAYGQKRAREVGADHVYDFSLGNPSIPAPESVKQSILRLLELPPEQLHGYTAAQGDLEVRQKVAASISRRFGVDARPEQLYMTCGAAASLSCCIRALTNPQDEWIAIAPFFPEYRCFVEAARGVLVQSDPNPVDFQMDLGDLEAKITERTKAIIVNSPNNPCGVVYTEESILALAELLYRKQEQYGHPIYLIADEPYREIVYGDVKVPYLPRYYRNTFVCYSYSKSLSLPGERIGYIYVYGEMDDFDKLYPAICGAGRSLGYVCAPSLFQRVIADCVEDTGDISAYEENGRLLYESLTDYGFTCIQPQGAFYLFVKALEEDANAFCEYAKKKYDLLLVPSDSFGVPGYVRVSYCVSNDMIRRALPCFRQLAEDYASK